MYDVNVTGIVVETRDRIVYGESPDGPAGPIEYTEIIIKKENGKKIVLTVAEAVDALSGLNIVFESDKIKKLVKG